MSAALELTANTAAHNVIDGTVVDIEPDGEGYFADGTVDPQWRAQSEAKVRAHLKESYRRMCEETGQPPEMDPWDPRLPDELIGLGTQLRVRDDDAAAEWIIPNPERHRRIEHTWEDAGVSDWAADYLHERGVSAEVAMKRGIRTGDRFEELPMEFQTPPIKRHMGQFTGGRLSFMVLPLYSTVTSGTPCINQLRFEEPRSWEGADGEKAIKFEIPKGAVRGPRHGFIPADVHPDRIRAARETKAPLLFTEGAAKADAMLTAAYLEDLDVVPVSFTGVTMPYITDCDPDDSRRVTGHRLTTAVTEAFDLDGRIVYLVWDGDWRTKDAVRKALFITGDLLAEAGADVRIVDVPAIDGDDTPGVDDYLADIYRIRGTRMWAEPVPLACLLANAAPLGTVKAGAELVVAEARGGQYLAALAGVSLDFVDEVDHRPGARYAPLGDPLPWSQVVERGSGWSVISADPTRKQMTFARLDGPRTGVFRAKVKIDKVKGDDGQELIALVATYEMVADWVPWRSAVVRTYRGNAEEGTPRYTVTVATAAGGRYQVDLDGDQADEPAIIRRATDAPLALSTAGIDVGALRDCLAKLGTEDRPEHRQYSSTGWLQAPDKRWVYGAPVGSVGADGIREDVTVVPPGTNRACARTGWTRTPSTPEEHRAGIEALMALKTITPGRPEWWIAQLGALCAGPLAMATRTTLVVHGERGSTKSLGQSCVNAALCDIGVSASGGFPISVPKSTGPGTRKVLQFFRHSMVVADDYRRAGSSETKVLNSKAGEVFQAVAQGGYGESGENKSTQDGQLRAEAEVECLPVMTAETLTVETAWVERCATLRLRKGDIPGTGEHIDRNGPVDRFRDAYADTGLILMGFAGFLQYLAQQMDAGAEDGWDGLAGMTHWAEESHRRHMERLRTARAASAVAVLATGWTAFMRYAKAVGCVDLLPDRQFVYDALEAMADEVSDAHRRADPAAVVLTQLSEMIAGGEGCLRPYDGAPPVGREMLFGWSKNSQCDWAPARVAIGFLSDERGPGHLGHPDGDFVLVSKTAIRAAMRHGGIEGFSPEQVYEAVAKLCPAESNPGGPVPARWGIGERGSLPRGYLLPLKDVLAGRTGNADSAEDDEEE